MGDGTQLINLFDAGLEQGSGSKWLDNPCKTNRERTLNLQGKQNFSQLGDLRVSFERQRASLKPGWLAAGSRRGRDKGSERQTGELRVGVLDRLAGSAQGACDWCVVSALDMDRLMRASLNSAQALVLVFFVLSLLSERDSNVQ